MEVESGTKLCYRPCMYFMRLEPCRGSGTVVPADKTCRLLKRPEQHSINEVIRWGTCPNCRMTIRLHADGSLVEHDA